MESQAESKLIIDIVRSVEPWVWPATAAIVVGGLIVFWTLRDAGLEAASPTAVRPGHRVSSEVGLEPFALENRTNVRAN